MRFRKLRNDRGPAVTLDFLHGLISFEADLSTADQVSTVTVRGWDPATKAALIGQATAGDLNGAMGGTTTGPAGAEVPFGARALAVIDQPVATQNEADLLARGILNEIALDYIVGEGVAAGDPAITAGSVIELGGLGRRFSGRYYLTEVTHVWDGRFTTRFRVRRNAAS
jgi:phage protein D